MEINKDYLSKFKIGKSNSSEEKELCREIWEWSGKTFNFGMLIVFCRRNGIQCVRECFIESVKSGSADPKKLFMYLVKKNGTKFND